MSRLWIATFAAALLAFLFYGAGCSERALPPTGDGGSGGPCAARSLPECEQDSRCMLQPGCCDSSEIACVAAGTPQPVCHCEAGCAGLDETACTADPSCRADYCNECSCSLTFVGCTRPTDPPTACPGLGCPQPICQCDSLPESACIAAESSLGCTPFYCPDCNGGQTFSGCFGPNSGAGACPADCAQLTCRGQQDCPNGGLCVAPSQGTTCPADCTQGTGCKSDGDCGKSQICDFDPCSCTNSKSCVPSCLNGTCDSGQTCGANGRCQRKSCNADGDCNPPCTGPLNCPVDFCVDQQCYPSLGSCGPPPV